MIENTSEVCLSQILEPSKFSTCLGCLYHPWQECNFPQTDFMIFRNFNIYVSSAAYLVHVERILSEKLRIWVCLFFLLVKMADREHNKTSIVFLIIKHTKIFISLFERTFKMMKNGVYFIVIALLVVEIFEIFFYAN